MYGSDLLKKSCYSFVYPNSSIDLLCLAWFNEAPWKSIEVI